MSERLTPEEQDRRAFERIYCLNHGGEGRLKPADLFIQRKGDGYITIGTTKAWLGWRMRAAYEASLKTEQAA